MSGGGMSLFYQNSSWALFVQKLKVTLTLSAAALFLSLGASVTVYFFSPLEKLESITRILSGFLVSLPVLFFAPLLIFTVAHFFVQFPILYQQDNVLSFLLPILILSLRPFGVLLRLLGAEAHRWSSSQTAQYMKSLGFSERSLRLKWVFKLSLIPVLTSLVGLVSSLFAGSLITESFFSIPGVGSAYVQALLQRDYPVFTSWTIYFAFVFLVLQAVFDFVHMKLDPRVEIRS